MDSEIARWLGNKWGINPKDITPPALLNFLNASGFSIYGYDWGESHYVKLWRTLQSPRFFLVVIAKDVDPFMKFGRYMRLPELGAQSIPRRFCLCRDFKNLEAALLYSCIKVINLQLGNTEKLRPRPLEF